MEKNVFIAALFSFCLLSACFGTSSAGQRKNASDCAVADKESGTVVQVFKDYFTFALPEGWEKYLSSNEKTADKNGKYQAGVSHECAKMTVSYFPDLKQSDDSIYQFFGSPAKITDIDSVKKNIRMFLCKRCSGKAEETEVNGMKAIKITSEVQNLNSGSAAHSEQYVFPAADGYYSISYSACSGNIGKKHRHVFEKALSTFKGTKFKSEENKKAKNSAE